MVNLTPNLTSSSGSCEASSATLILTEQQTITLNFTFTLVRSSLLFCEFTYMVSLFFVYSTPLYSRPQNSTSNKYHLSAISLLANWPDMTSTSLVTSNILFFLGSDLLNLKNYQLTSLHSSLLSQQHQPGLPAEHAGPLLHVQHRANPGRGADLLSQHIQTAGPTL